MTEVSKPFMKMSGKNTSLKEYCDFKFANNVILDF